ncbi:Succinyl-CoA ligase [ADP-forming] beta chain [hydrothermal vent metagenome]|uniref:Succinyl-CoA ligase [ADP-forming] beta chain n=1 Tax=hydrothermal vent metagenome TaxID=652676 RepID=A0A3B1D0B3_9ZZZZ|nr:ADP-forming succinate--CoA ligase subunit beta [Candidatus Manganitrophaceae bacterium]
MNIHEYQAKALFATYKIPVPKGNVAFSADEAATIAATLESAVCVVKAQIHAGGRGKAGGVKLAKTRDEVIPFANEILGKILVTPQTGPEGKEVRKLLIEEGADIQNELYVSLVDDRATGSIVIIASTEGGMEIEEVAEATPEKIIRCVVDPVLGYQAYQGRSVAFQMALPKEVIGQFVKLLGNLYRLFVEKNATQIEINPLIITGDNRLIALDAKVGFDDSALFKHPDINELRDLDEEDPLETRAAQHGLNYVKLDGKIGCMVNGAGLAMSTMDVIKLAGSEPANFLDVGGGASKETVQQAFQILLDDPNVKGVFVNIFGGIVRCDRIAGGIIEAAKEVDLNVPLVVRLEGTNAKEAKDMLAASDIKLIVADTLWDGAQKIVAAVT